MLLCTACTSIPTPQEKPEMAWFAMGFGCNKEPLRDYAKELEGVCDTAIFCFPYDDSNDPTFTGSGNYDDYWRIRHD